MRVLDTNVFSALMRGDPAPVEHLLRHAPADVLVPHPVVAEIRYGLSRLPRSKRREALEQRCDVLCNTLSRTPWTDEVSRHFGLVKAELERKGLRLDDFDIAIAAHALAIDAVLVTRNARHLGRVAGLSLEDWTTA